jgi:transcriptional regulator with PAS, ATPase and Fis domain
VRRVGATAFIATDVRVIAATNRDLAADVEAGRFRADLFYRIAVYVVEVPPLRERTGDLPMLVEFLLAHIPEAQRRDIRGVNRSVLEALRRHAWPGNVRELENVLRSASVRCTTRQVHLDDLPARVKGKARAPGRFAALDDVVREHVREALRQTGGNQAAAARLLGIHRNTLRKHLVQMAALDRR